MGHGHLAYRTDSEGSDACDFSFSEGYGNDRHRKPFELPMWWPRQSRPNTASAVQINPHNHDRTVHKPATGAHQQYGQAALVQLRKSLVPSARLDGAIR
jgi:hypothetical protein